MAVILSIVLALVISCMAVSTAHAAQRLPWNGREIEGCVCDGNVLKPKHGANSSNTWIYANGVIKPKYGANSHNTFEVGDAPLLVIAGATVLRLF